MSAYMVGKDHIAYLLAAADRCQPKSYGDFSWRHGGQWHKLNHETRLRVAQMLMDANLASVAHRYPGDHDLPGPTNEGYLFTQGDLRSFPAAAFSPVQVFKSCHCYEYQSSERDDWKESEARAFIESLISATCHHMPGYDDAEWGAPTPYLRAAVI